MNDLKPCPLCGGEAEMHSDGMINCADEGCNMWAHEMGKVTWQSLPRQSDAVHEVVREMRNFAKNHVAEHTRGQLHRLIDRLEGVAQGETGKVVSAGIGKPADRHAADNGGSAGKVDGLEATHRDSVENPISGCNMVAPGHGDKNGGTIPAPSEDAEALARKLAKEVRSKLLEWGESPAPEYITRGWWTRWLGMIERLQPETPAPAEVWVILAEGTDYHPNEGFLSQRLAEEVAMREGGSVRSFPVHGSESRGECAQCVEYQLQIAAGRTENDRLRRDLSTVRSRWEAELALVLQAQRDAVKARKENDQLRRTLDRWKEKKHRSDAALDAAMDTIDRLRRERDEEVDRNADLRQRFGADSHKGFVNFITALIDEICNKK